MKISRNAPCPCGSGKKYKRCCYMTATEEGLVANATNSFADEIRKQAELQGASSIEELESIAEQLSGDQNMKAMDDFLGLSPNHMSGLLYQPFESPKVVSFTRQWQPRANILTLFEQMIAGFDEGVMRATAKGNLPLALCKSIDNNYTNGLKGIGGFRGGIRSEQDFSELHTVRIVAELANLIKFDKKQYVITDFGKTLLGESARGELYFVLFKAYTTEFNWGYRDGYPELDIVQRSFLFTLYMLTRFGDDEQDLKVYGDYFIKAFPMVVDEMQGDAYFSASEQAQSAYYVRALERFAYFFGLIEFLVDDKYRGPLDERRLKKTAQLDAFITFFAKKAPYLKLV